MVHAFFAPHGPGHEAMKKSEVLASLRQRDFSCQRRHLRYRTLTQLPTPARFDQDITSAENLFGRLGPSPRPEAPPRGSGGC